MEYLSTARQCEPHIHLKQNKDFVNAILALMLDIRAKMA